MHTVEPAGYLTSNVFLLAPDGGETLYAGETYSLGWVQHGTLIKDLSLWYSTDGGNNWEVIDIFVDSHEGWDSYTWTVPEVTTWRGRARLKAWNIQDYIAGDGSADNFTIVQPWITVFSPNGGENWQAGSTHDIRWNSEGSSGSVSIDYSTNGEGSWSEIISSTEDDGSFSWFLPNTPSSNCLVRVSDVDGHPGDSSDQPFTLLAPGLLPVPPSEIEAFLLPDQI